MRQSIKRDLEMLGLLAISTKQAVCGKYKITIRGLDSWLYRIRKRRIESRAYLNKLLVIERRNPRLKKILLSAQEDEDLIQDLLNLED